jgi:prepilin-type N-terminal cleavage/methylation domain-containing protein
MHSRRGFTLIEIMAALVIGGITLATIVQVIVLLLASAKELTTLAADHEARMTAHHRIRSVLGSIQQPVGTKWFRGTRDEAEFTGALRTSADGFRTSTVRLSVHGGRLTALAPDDGEYVLTAADSVAFEYLAGHGLNAPFLPAWSSSSEPPVAIRVRLARRDTRDRNTVDTLLVPVRAHR